MKHELNRLGSDNFERLIQALMSKLFGIQVKIYGDGPDRQREAVIENAHCTICGEVVAQGRTIVQAKFKSPDGKLDDWSWLQTNLKKELDGFAKKAKKEPEFLPNTWLFFTNIVLTPAKGGVKDKAEALVAQYRHLIPNIQILGADELRSLLDANTDVARRYAAFLVPGDVLAESLDYLSALKLEPLKNLMEYVLQRFRADEPVRLEQAGNVAEGTIAVRNVYTDLEAEGEWESSKHIDGLAAAILRLGDQAHPRELREENTPHLIAPANNIVLIGNAGQGKSTLCQFICQLYRASLLAHYRPEVNEAHDYAKQSGITCPKCERFPILIRLKEYAAWVKRQQDVQKNCSVVHYLRSLMTRDGITNLSIILLRNLLKSYSWIFFFDGLDEVPASSNRTEILRQIDMFLSQDLTEAQCDSLVICTSRPQGYDAAFSPRRYRHFELKEMSSQCCIRYIDRLLNYLEQSSDYREKYHSILVKALDDPLVAKLMTTPLYTSILVLLVKSGITPPTRRYELFKKYCEIVQQRELQKELLPSLYDGNYVWISELHGLIAYLLQSESETAENAAAELSTARCRALIKDYLEEEQWQGDTEKKVNELYHAITERLPFLAETTDADSNPCVLFPLRSLQEYFTAERLLKIEEMEKRREVLEALSLNAYWRNVFLFIAGFYSNQDSRAVNDSVYAICKGNNGDPCFSGRERTACQIALPGSRLAVDLLRDNLFERRNGQERYLILASELLKWDSADISPVSTFMKLPPVLLDRFVRDWAIPYVRETKNPDEAAFELLCEVARKGNADVKECLEDLADELPFTSDRLFARLLWQKNTIGLGKKLLNRFLEWFTGSSSNMLVYFDGVWPFLENCCITLEWEELPQPVRRLIAYFSLKGNNFDLRIKHRKTSRLHKLLKQDKLLSAAVYAWEQAVLTTRMKTSRFTTFSHMASENAEVWSDLKVLSEQNGFDELVALAAFHADPAPKMLAALMTACCALPENWRSSFCMVLREHGLLLRSCAEAILAGEPLEDVLSLRCNEPYFKSIKGREKFILDALATGDYDMLMRLDAWPDLNMVFLDNEAWLPAAIVAASESSCQQIMRFLDPFFDHEVLSDEYRHALLQRFPLAFHSWESTMVALSAFSQEPLADLVSRGIEYPTFLPQNIMNIINDTDTVVPSVLDRIQKLSALGGSFLNVYSLLPYVFHAFDPVMFHRMVEEAMTQYDEVKATKNDCALLGVILLMLTDRVPSDRKGELISDLRRLMKGIDLSAWFHFPQEFSLEGQLLAHEVGSIVYKGTESESVFFNLSRRAILQKLETLPVDRSKLPTPGTLA